MDPEIVVAAAAAAFVLGYLIINQVILRLVLLAGTALYIVYYYIAADTPLWGAIYTSSLTFAANLIGLAMLFARRAAWTLPAEFRDLRPRFHGVSPGDLRTIMRHATRHTTDADQTLTVEGRPVDTLYYVIKGRLDVEKLGEAFRIPDGVFIGEVAFLTQSHSRATIRLRQGAEVISWPVAALQRQARANPRAKLALDAILSHDLANKVALSVAPHNMPPGMFQD